MLYDFLRANKDEILNKTELKTVELSGNRPSSAQLKQGLPIFFSQLLAILRLQRAVPGIPSNKKATAAAAQNSNEQGMALASGKPEEADLAASASQHGIELLRLGYTLSHVIHAYGAICQSVTEVATEKAFSITAAEFHEFNQCLDVAIAGAVNGYQDLRNAQENSRETKDLGFLAHEMRNALTSASLAFQIIKRGTVGPLGSTGQVVDRSLSRLEDLIARGMHF